jgi:plastocyanin
LHAGKYGNMTAFLCRHLLRTGFACPADVPVLATGIRRASAATHEVEISSLAFSHARLRVAVVNTLVFTNSHGGSHAAKAVYYAFDTGTVKKSKSALITITAAGRMIRSASFIPTWRAR